MHIVYMLNEENCFNIVLILFPNIYTLKIIYTQSFVKFIFFSINFGKQWFYIYIIIRNTNIIL